MNAIEPLHAIVMNKFTALMGEEKATALYADVLRESALSAIVHPGDLLAVAEVLLRRRGVLAAVGRSLKIQAIFLGAGAD